LIRWISVDKKTIKLYNEKNKDDIHIGYTWEVILCIYVYSTNEILYFDCLSPSHFTCGFVLRQEKKRRKDVVVDVLPLVKYHFICSFAFVFAKASIHTWKEKYRKNERKKERRRRQNAIFCCWNIKSSSGQFISSSFLFHRYSLAYLCFLLLQRYFAPIT